MGSGFRIVAILAALSAGQVRRSRRRKIQAPGVPSWSQWLGDPRSAVLLVLASALGLGGGRKLLQWWRARAAVERLGLPEPAVEDVEAASGHGRAAIMDLFRILGTAETEPLRTAAGRSLATLWGQDNLIAEEEKALVLRSFSAAWQARRRYPRALRAPIPITVSYGIPFLRSRAEGPGIGVENLEWSHRILGTCRADDESFSPWKPGAGHAEFTLIPGDFETDGPHRILLHARVRTAGLTDAWELDLPQTPFHLEFDPRLLPESLLTLADEPRGEWIARAVRLESVEIDESQAATYLPLNDSFAIRNPPPLAVTTPLPCDLAHAVALEIEGTEGRLEAGAVVLSGQGQAGEQPAAIRRFPLGPLVPLAADAIERPGTRRLRAILTADPDRGWADPEVRSIWPGTIETEWVEVQVVRR